MKSQGWEFEADGAQRAASNSVRTVSGGSGSGEKERVDQRRMNSGSTAASATRVERGTTIGLEGAVFAMLSAPSSNGDRSDVRRSSRRVEKMAAGLVIGARALKSAPKCASGWVGRSPGLL